MTKKTALSIGFALSALCLSHAHADSKPLVVASAFPAAAPMPVERGGDHVRNPEAAMRLSPIQDVAKGVHGLSYFLAKNSQVIITLYTMNGDVVKTWYLKAGIRGAQAGVNHFRFPNVPPGSYMAEISVDSSHGVFTVTEHITLP